MPCCFPNDCGQEQEHNHQQQQPLLPPTENDSPLTSAIHVWDKELRTAHDCFCCEKGSCAGPRPLSAVLSDPDEWQRPADGRSRCLQAIEAELLLHMLYFGLRLRDKSVRDEDIPGFEVENYPCPEEERAQLEATLRKEIDAGYIVFLDHKPRWLSPIHGKKEATKVRLLRDFSVPEGRAINDFANNRPFKMMQHEDAYALMRPYAFMAKVDVANAYRTVGIHPADRKLTCFKWEFDGVMRYCMDKRAMMGHAVSPSCFCRLSQAVRAILAAKGYEASVVFVDDFFQIEDLMEDCAQARDRLAALLGSLGFTA